VAKVRGGVEPEPGGRSSPGKAMRERAVERTPHLRTRAPVSPDSRYWPIPRKIPTVCSDSARERPIHSTLASRRRRRM